jgi:hypothetical protein
MTKENFIGLNRVRRHHNAIFVSFADATVPSECMEAARLNWQRVCIKQSDVTTEQTLRKVCVPGKPPGSGRGSTSIGTGNQMAPTLIFIHIYL